MLLLPACVAFALNATASEIDLPLLQNAKALQCAQTEPVAKAALSRFWDVQSNNFFIPIEDRGELGDDTLHAATLDIILKTLVDTVERYPDLRNQVERTMLQWNYCDVFDDGVFYDLKYEQGGVERIKAVYNAPESWQGFKSLGFLGESDDRFVPEIISLDQNNLRMDFEQLFHRIYREQCFPHPDTAELFDITKFDLEEKVAPAVVGESEEYPHYWESDCVYPREAPELQTELLIESIPVLAPMLETAIKLEDVPQLVPRLESGIELLQVEQIIPKLETETMLLPVEQLVPRLDTEAKLLPVEQLVPSLKSAIEVVVSELAVPELDSSLEIIPVPRSIPELETTVELMPTEVDIPLLETALEIVEQPLDIPVLVSRVEFDQAKPKVFVKPVAKPAPQPIVLASSSGGVGGFGGGVASVVAPRQVVVKPAIQKVITQVPVVEKVTVQAPVVQTQRTVVVDKNAPLLERLLSSLNNGSNVLIIDKIQLTVNEYNGNVETAISSSDVGVGATVPTIDKTVLVKELLGLETKKLVTTSKDVSVKKAQFTNKEKVVKKAKPAVSTPQPRYVKVPRLETMLLVNQSSSNKTPKKTASIPSKPSKVKVPSLKPKLAVRKKSVAVSKKKTYKAPKKDIVIPKSSGSSTFIYKPYDWGDKPGDGQKSVEELLQEYADYEARRKAGRAARKKPKPKNTSSWKAKKTTKIGVKQNTSNTKKTTKVVKKQDKKKAVNSDKKSIKQAKPSETPLASVAKKAEEKVSFAFADGVPDYPDVNQVTAVDTNVPSGLLDDAPLPYVIEENFINDQEPEVDPAEAKKSKKAKKKPIGLAGGVYLKKSLGSGKWGIGGSINRKIIKDDYWFARVGWSYSLEEDEDPFSYSWGIGYSDWHSGTFSAQLNNWGPIKMGEGFALDKAIASFGYSVKSELLKKYRLSLSGALNIPIDGNSSASVNTRWSPVENWYINASVSQPLEGDGDPKWSYGFGYSDWRPNKFNLQYSNYGPNDLFYHNYQSNGTWSLSYNWKF